MNLTKKEWHAPSPKCSPGSQEDEVMEKIRLSYWFLTCLPHAHTHTGVKQVIGSGGVYLSQKYEKRNVQSIHYIVLTSHL